VRLHSQGIILAVILTTGRVWVHPVAPPNDQDEARIQRPGVTSVDLLVYAAILVLGAFDLYSHLRSPDFPFEDVAYYEQAKSLLQDGYYGFNSVP
jgi:hypothetical protein